MAQSHKNRPAAPPSSYAAATPASHSGAAASLPGTLDAPMAVKILMGVHMAIMLAIVLWMTPLTNNLDDIKVSLFLALGPVLALLALGVFALGAAPLPRPVIGASLLAYYVVFAISALHSKFHWITWYQTMFHWSTLGFFLSGVCIGSWRQSSRRFVRFLVLQLLLTNLIGFFMFDVTGSPEHHSAVAYAFHWIYGKTAQAPVGGSSWYNLLYTLYGADNAMQSTILSRDFYPAFCILFLPFALLLGIDPGRGRLRGLWQVTGLITALLSVLCVFFAQSKGELIFGSISTVLFVGGVFLVGQVEGTRRRHIFAWLGGLVILLGVVAWMKSPTLFGQLKSISFSVSSRSIIFAGAWKIFLKFPILGGGPGTFRQYFPQFRRPDYFEHEISHLTLSSHNYILDLFAETGILGAVTFLFFLVVITLLTLRWIWRHPDQRLRLWLLASLCGLFAFFGSNSTSPNARWVIGATPLWTVLGLMTGFINQATREPQAALATTPTRFPIGTRQWALIGGLALIGLVMLPCGIVKGTRYWNSALEYAQGVTYLEEGYNLNEGGKTDPQTVLAYLFESIPHFENAIKADPGINQTVISTFYKAGSGYMSISQKYAETVQTLLNEGKQQEAEAQQALADQYMIKAKEKYEELQQYFPDYAEIHYNLGIVYQSYADYLKRIAAKYPDAATDASGKPYLEQVKDYEKKALEHLETMGKMSKKDEVAKLEGSQYVTMGYYDKARDVYRKASADYPGDESLAKNYYRTALTVQDYPGATEALERLWKKSPAKDELIEDLLTIGRDHQIDPAVKEVADRLAKINPVHPLLFAARLYLAQRQHKPEDELAAAKDYAKVGGIDPEVYLQGGEAASALHRQAEADDLYRRVLALDKDGKTTFSTLARQRLGLAGPVAGPVVNPTASPTSPTAPAAPAAVNSATTGAR